MQEAPTFLSVLRGRPQILALLVFAALVMAGNGLVAPVLSYYGATFSASATLVGLVITLFGIGRLAVNIPAGLLAQRLGRRPVLLAGPVLLIAGSVGAALADSMVALLVWRFVQGIGSGIYMTVSTLMLADQAGDADRGRLMALFQASLLFGTGFGPPIGGFVADHWGPGAPFWAYALTCLAGLAVAFALIGETLPPEARTIRGKTGGGRESQYRILRDSAFLGTCLANFAIFFTRTAALWMAIPMLALSELGYSLALIGLALSLVTLTNFLALPWAGQGIDRFGAARVSCLSLGTTALALTAIALGGIAAFWAGLVLTGVAGAFSGPAVATHAAEIAPRRAYGAAFGLLRSSGDLGFVIGPLLVGFLGDCLGMTHRGALLLNAALLVLAALATLGAARAARRRKTAPPPTDLSQD